MKLEELKPGATVSGVLEHGPVTVVNVQWFGTEALELTYKTSEGTVANELLYRDSESRLKVVEGGRPWSFDGDGALFRLVSEAHRIRLAHLFDPVLAVHTSVVEPLPHQITAVYEAMLPRQPLRFLLADDPGAGKTIMAGLLIRELLVRGDLQRCLIVCPGSLAEQWQDELARRFQLPFEILTNAHLETAHSGNWFLERDLIIARLDKLSRDEDAQGKLKAPDCRWDLVVCDEAHKMSATFFGGEAKYTKRYRLGQLLSGLTRHLLLMTATPHNGKDTDFQLFMALLDRDRFEGRFRDGVHSTEVGDLMRRMVKERLLKFNGRPLFPERVAHTVPFKLSADEARLYREVTAYVREEFDRAEALQNDRRAGTVGFALTILQRRLASSPEAIYQSLRRRRKRLDDRLHELEQFKRSGQTRFIPGAPEALFDRETLEDLEDAPEEEIEEIEGVVLDEATAARSITELQAEIETLKRLEALAKTVRQSGGDTKWRELAGVLDSVFSTAPDSQTSESSRPKASPRQKLVLFTEHRDTLRYLHERIATLLGRPDAVVVIHGSMRREDRRETQEAFTHDPRAQVLLATDAAGEGINLQRAHLMVNYDLPWNPNRLEQRFGRIHRIGQKEVCHLWNLVAQETREGDVYQRLLDKLETARKALGGQVFDVLGKVQFEGKPLRDLLLEAIRYGEQPEVRARLTTTISEALDRAKLQGLLEQKALASHVMDTSEVRRVRDDMERAEARRLQPHFVEAFFLEAFGRLGGSAKQREPRRYEVTRVPAALRNRSQLAGSGAPVLPRYERIAFDKPLLAPPGKPPAAFVCPGHPLLDAVIDLTLERDRAILKRGAVLVDERDPGAEARMLFYLEHSIQDATRTRTGERRTLSRRMLYVQLAQDGQARHLHYAPYLDYRPLSATDPSLEAILKRKECAWIDHETEKLAQAYAIQHVVPEHLKEIREGTLERIGKIRAAVQDRLTKEINYWDHRAAQLEVEEKAGRTGNLLNSREARKRADILQERLRRRLDELKLESQIAPLPPVVAGGLLVVPKGLIDTMTAPQEALHAVPADTQQAAARARDIVMATERELGYSPRDREFERLGYDIESRDPATGKLRFIEVKGRVSGADTITVTRNEILYSLNKPGDFILALVEFLDAERHQVRYVRQPFGTRPDFGVTSVNYDFAELLARAEEPR